MHFPHSDKQSPSDEEREEPADAPMTDDEPFDHDDDTPAADASGHPKVEKVETTKTHKVRLCSFSVCAKFPIGQEYSFRH